ncbi:MAG: hypothetical protein J0H49_31700, partial [Acidobacteria bacterium]|nr:hypothetical protein [Acidobacteriota bacterium]
MPRMMRNVLTLAALMGCCALLPAQTAPGANRTRNPHGPLKVACETCHTSSSWRPLRAQPEFNHNTETSYPLRGMHAGVACSGCHVSRVFKDVGHACSACHADIHRRQFGGRCEDCHTVKGWRTGVQQTREHSNRFPLIGAHATVPCESCHRGAAVGQYLGLSTDCAACHTADFTKAQNPPHTSGRFAIQCESCHGMDTWRGARFDHQAVTGFALTGSHTTLECRSCHVGGRYAGTPAQCFDCHNAQFASTSDPNHVQAGFPRECQTCHTTSTWRGAVFDHAARTKFTLVGAHTSVACSACHVAGRFAGTPQQCDGCHMPDYQRTVNPNHAASSFPKDCASCHTTTVWKGAKFDHSLSRFPLTGAHTNVECALCHVAGKYTGTAQTCEGCHIKAYETSTNPAHVAAAFPKTCGTCHTTTQWKGAQFDHATGTRFPLTGSHTSVTCLSCHVGNKFAGTAATCEGCHLKDFTAAKSPDHATAGFPKDCTVCHTTTQWKGASFDHSAMTKFPLTGAHSPLACQSCHVGGQFAGTPQACAGCHLKDFQGTTSPNHQAAGFSQECASCHTTTQWKGAQFDHGKTKFPLTGSHTTVACASCHVGGKYTGTPAACSGCHLKDYQGTTNPNHAASGFPTECNVCHTTVQWKGAKFDHAQTKFPLTGAHSTAQCASCHVGGKFTGTVATCEGCHLPDYQKTSNPNHASAGFSTSCSICHTTTQWKGAQFDHSKTKFSLTGAHVATACQSCHIGNKFVGTPSTCEGCHTPDFQKTTSPNHTAAGFPKDCTVCHTTTQWKGAKFDHSTMTKFALTGKHAQAQCSSCHVNNLFKGTPQT